MSARLATTVTMLIDNYRFSKVLWQVSHTEKSLLSTFHLIGGVEMQFLLSCNNMSIKQHLTCPKEKRLSSITRFHNDIIASGSYTDMNEMSKDDLELLSDALGGLTRKQINNVLCMSTRFGKRIEHELLFDREAKTCRASRI